MSQTIYTVLARHVANIAWGISGWFVSFHNVEGVFRAQALVAFEETLHIAEAQWVSPANEPMPEYVIEEQAQ